MQPTSEPTPPSAPATEAAPVSVEYQQYRALMDRFKEIEAKHDFTPEGEAEYNEARDKARSAYSKLVDYEQSVGVRK
jgi:hypothetical protein